MCARRSSARRQNIEREGGERWRNWLWSIALLNWQGRSHTRHQHTTGRLKHSPVLVDFCRKESLTVPKSDRRWRKACWSLSGGSFATQIHSSGSVTVTVLRETVGSQTAISPSFTLSLLLTSFSWLEVSTASILTSGVRLSRGSSSSSSSSSWEYL